MLKWPLGELRRPERAMQRSHQLSISIRVDQCDAIEKGYSTRVTACPGIENARDGRHTCSRVVPAELTSASTTSTITPAANHVAAQEPEN